MRDAAGTSATTNAKHSSRKNGFTKHHATGTSSMSRPTSARRIKTQVISLLFAISILTAHIGVALAAVSQGYVTNDTELRPYMAVKIGSDDAQGHPVVQTSSYLEPDNTIGIAVGLSDTLVTVAPVSSEVYVVSSGTAQAYISDINGAVKRGDLLAVSPLRGILMRSTDPTRPTVGQALEDFITKTTSTVIARDAKDKQVEVHLAVMNMDVAIKPPKLTSSAEDNNWVKSIGNSLVGHEISAVRVFAALAVFFTLLVIEGELIYGTIASTITAIGRNPLAKKSIVAQSFKSVRIAAVVLIIGAASVGLLLWL